MNQTQLLLVIPVSKYKQVTTPINGISEYFLITVRIERRIQIIQKIIKDILGVARSIKLDFPLI